MDLFHAVSLESGTATSPLTDGAQRMYVALTTLVDRLEDPLVPIAGIVPWWSPVPSFGDLSNSQIATVGLNPSNREFVDVNGNELQGSFRRFYTLQSLGLTSWSDVDARHLRLILGSCRDYFRRNPYDRWFRRLDDIVSGVRASYYGPAPDACHVDLVPYATATKWATLGPEQRAALLALAGDSLGMLLRNSPVRVIALNGSSVVEHFQVVAHTKLTRRRMPAWSLPRSSGRGVAGFAYTGHIDSIAGIPIGHTVLVLGFNHNLQSSYGVTSEIVRAIRDWVARAAAGCCHEAG